MDVHCRYHGRSRGRQPACAWFLQIGLETECRLGILFWSCGPPAPNDAWLCCFGLPYRYCVRLLCETQVRGPLVSESQHTLLGGCRDNFMPRARCSEIGRIARVGNMDSNELSRHGANGVAGQLLVVFQPMPAVLAPATRQWHVLKLEVTHDGFAGSKTTTTVACSGIRGTARRERSSTSGKPSKPKIARLLK